MAKHYLLLVFPDGKQYVRREYLELSDPDETAESALDRWVESHPNMINRQRNRERTARALRESILYVQLCHPSSWYRERRGAGLTEPVKRVRRRGA